MLFVGCEEMAGGGGGGGRGECHLETAEPAVRGRRTGNI